MTTITSTPRLVTVFGGSGFIGRHLVQALARRGYRIRIATRRPDLAGHAAHLGNVGQIQPVQANLRVRWSVDRAVEGADHVVNLVGILHESGRQRFSTIHDFGARAVAEAARAQGATMTQLSALGASPDSSSDYARTKAAGEWAVLETLPGKATVIRPSIVFGPEDRFFNRFADMARFSPALPLIGGGHTRFQPVYVADLAEAIARTVDGKVPAGGIYEVGGPEVLTFRECMETMLDVIERKRMLVTVPWWLARIQGSILGMLPGSLLTSDQVRQLETDNVVSAEADRDGRTLAGMGISPRAVGAILPTYLWSYRRAGQYTRPQQG